MNCARTRIAVSITSLWSSGLGSTPMRMSRHIFGPRLARDEQGNPLGDLADRAQPHTLGIERSQEGTH